MDEEESSLLSVHIPVVIIVKGHCVFYTHMNT